jgi:hypothetical protein
MIYRADRLNVRASLQGITGTGIDRSPCQGAGRWTWAAGRVKMATHVADYFINAPSLSGRRNRLGRL